MSLAIPFRIESFDELNSTQDLLRQRLEAGEAVHGLVVRAARQTAGRGQRTRDWHSSSGGSYQTIAIKTPTALAFKQTAVTVAMAIGLAEVLPCYGVKVDIKWPNDLYYRGKKLAGILTEYCRGHLLIGVGVNVNNQVPDAAIGLRGWNLEGVHAMVLEGTRRGLDLMAADYLADLYKNYDLLLNQQLELVNAKQNYIGIARGIDSSGCLKLEQSTGQVISFCSGHILRFNSSLCPGN